jgi:hypothetical protein
VKSRREKSLYDRVAELPEQTWSNAWAGIPRKKSDIYFPLGLDGGRQRFRLQPQGGFEFRTNDEFLRRRPGTDTPRLDLEAGNGSVSFDLPARPAFRTLDEESLPIVTTRWERDGVRIEQITFVTVLIGMQADALPPPGDASTVLLARFNLANSSSEPKDVTLPLHFKAGGKNVPLRAELDGLLWSGDNVRGQFIADVPPGGEPSGLQWKWTLAPGESRSLVLKLPYVVLTEATEHAALKQLDFEVEHQSVAGYWRRRLDESAKLITPEPMLNEFYRSHAMHLLVNCEREPNSDRRFARVGSFNYAAFGNESCMMVVDLDRRGYHKEAQECLDAWLHYQGTVELPGSFESKACSTVRVVTSMAATTSTMAGFSGCSESITASRTTKRGCAAPRQELSKAPSGSSAKPRALPRATNSSAGSCLPAASKTLATGGRGFPPVATHGADWTPPHGHLNRSNIPTPNGFAKQPRITTRRW